MESVLSSKEGGQAAVLVPGGAPEALNCDKGEVGEKLSVFSCFVCVFVCLFIQCDSLCLHYNAGAADPEQEEGVCQAGAQVRRLLGPHLLLWGGRHL